MKNHRATPEPPAWQVVVFCWFADMTHWQGGFGPWLAPQKAKEIDRKWKQSESKDKAERLQL
jgi:hypothetical protein